MTDRLSLYNGALRILGERRLSSLTENRSPRRQLDDIWNDSFVDRCLEQGQWNFAMRAIELAASDVVTPTFGYDYAFEMPTDWIKTAGVSLSETFDPPLVGNGYKEEVGYWLANSTPLYVRYISNDSQYGGDLNRWPQSFTEFAKALLAMEAGPVITSSVSRVDRATKLAYQLRLEARSNDAMNEPTAFPPEGGWNSSRAGGRGGDRGSRSRLIG